MINKKRDNFTKSVVRQLRERVNNICSNPDCSKQTLEPKKLSSDNTNLTGEASHICAASSGGPRYDVTMSEVNRKSIDNGIWLCKHCARKIDIEPEAYSVELLKDWKKKAELKVLVNSNKKIYTENEFEQKVQSKILQSHMNNQEFSNVANQTLNVITQSIQQELKVLDPRLNISCDYIDGITQYRIDVVSRGGEPVKIKINPNDVYEFSEKYDRLVDHGEFFHSSVENFISNSEAINFIFPKNIKNGTVTIEPTNTKKGSIEIIDHDDKIIVDLEGDFIIGRKSFSICACKFDKIFEISIKNIPLGISSNEEKIINISLNFEKWQGIDIRFLPYFDNVKKIYEKLENSKSLDFRILVGGLEVYKAINLYKSKKIASIYNALKYTNSCLRIAKKNDLSINFNIKCSFSSEEHRQIYEISELLCSNIELKEFKGAMTLNPNSKEVIVNLLSDNDYELIAYQLLNVNGLNMFNNIIDMRLYIKHVFRYPKFSLVKKNLKDNSYRFKIMEKNADSLYLREVSLKAFEFEDQVVLSECRKL